MKTLLLLGVCLAFACSGLRAEDDSDSDLVHGLAHGSAGAMVAMATDLGPVNVARAGYWKHTHAHLPWFVPVIAETGAAFLADELYEVATCKTPTVLAQHNLDASAAAALYALRVEVKF